MTGLRLSPFGRLGAAAFSVAVAAGAGSCGQHVAVVFWNDPDTMLPAGDLCLVNRSAILGSVRGVEAVGVSTGSHRCVWSYHDLGGPLPQARWSALADRLDGADLVVGVPLGEPVNVYLMGIATAGAPDPASEFPIVFCAHSTTAIDFSTAARVQLALDCAGTQRSSCIDVATMCR